MLGMFWAINNKKYFTINFLKIPKKLKERNHIIPINKIKDIPNNNIQMKINITLINSFMMNNGKKNLNKWNKKKKMKEWLDKGEQEDNIMIQINTIIFQINNIINHVNKN